MAINKYIITIKDIMRDELYDIECECYEELKRKWERYSKDTDYEVISMHSVLIEIRTINAKMWNDKIM